MKILVPCDGSDNALRAVQQAARTALSDPSVQLVLLHVLDPVTFRSRAASLLPEDLTRLYPEQAARALARARELLDLGGARYEVRCRLGDAANQIASEVDESGCERVIMGTRGMGAMSSLMVGSTAARVVSCVRVPVTLVK